MSQKAQSKSAWKEKKGFIYDTHSKGTVNSISVANALKLVESTEILLITRSKLGLIPKGTNFDHLSSMEIMIKGENGSGGELKR